MQTANDMVENNIESDYTPEQRERLLTFVDNIIQRDKNDLKFLQEDYALAAGKQEKRFNVIEQMFKILGLERNGMKFGDEFPAILNLNTQDEYRTLDGLAYAIRDRLLAEEHPDDKVEGQPAA